MCLSVPGQVIELLPDQDVLMGRVQFGGIVKLACLSHVPDVKVGEYVLVHVGFALSRVDEAEAKRIFEFLDSIAELGEIEEPAS